VCAYSILHRDYPLRMWWEGDDPVFTCQAGRFMREGRGPVRAFARTTSSAPEATIIRENATPGNSVNPIGSSRTPQFAFQGRPGRAVIRGTVSRTPPPSPEQGNTRPRPLTASANNVRTLSSACHRAPAET
jgi:hypothetical protein